jgi:exodeoxyribonuclease V alpha subunit
MIRGIGPVYAKKLVRAFGETVFDARKSRCRSYGR